MALQSFVGPWPLFQFLDLFTQSVGLLGRGISPLQGRYLHTGQHKHRINAYRHPCLKWDSNPRSQSLSERRQFMYQSARPLRLANSPVQELKNSTPVMLKCATAYDPRPISFTSHPTFLRCKWFPHRNSIRIYGFLHLKCVQPIITS
jgi:hypothetical protein